ncbi:hypothetical protein LUZ60_007135 [Juncus effusus]|nr:hypothetical protein LUZ60_007135 [Juncus effusus]
MKYYFLLKVGDPVVDHGCWERPETMTETRPLLYINKTSPGSDVAGETAATFAAASLVFKSTDATYSSTLLTHSEQLFNFADSNRGIYSETFPDIQLYYKSTGYEDELLWAASWLYHATGNSTYLRYAVENGAKFSGYGDPSYFGWDDKRAGIQVLLSRVHFFSNSTSLSNDIYDGLLNYMDTAEGVMCVIIPDTPVSTTDRTKNASPNDMRNFATSQAEYILGNNPLNMSYLVGFGTKYPQQVHHRGASIPADENPSCTDRTWLMSSNPNPNIAIGALVGGPSQTDTYDDVRTNALQGEPTTYSSALFTGLLTGLASTSPTVTSFT